MVNNPEAYERLRQLLGDENMPELKDSRELEAEKDSSKPRGPTGPQGEWQRGDLARPSDSFSPIQAVSKYPFKFVPEHLSTAIAKKFFNDDKFWENEFDLFYIWAPANMGGKPCLMIPVQQLETLLDKINNNLNNCNLIIGDEAESFGLVSRFPNHPDFLPRYLGKSASRKDYFELEISLSSQRGYHPPSKHEDEDGSDTDEDETPPHPDQAKHNEFLHTMKLIFDASKDPRKKKPSAAHRKLAREYMQQKAQASLRHTERALGLRPQRPHIPEITADTPWDEEVRIREARKNVQKPPPIDMNTPPPWEPEKYPLLVSLDVECYEWDKSKVTEIGIAFLDTRRVIGVAPGPEGTNWHDLVEARHYVIREHSFYKNANFVAGCADKFDFGTSETISKYEAKEVLRFWFESGWEDWVDHDEDEESSSGGGSENGGVSLVLEGDGKNQDQEPATAATASPRADHNKTEAPSTPILGGTAVGASSSSPPDITGGQKPHNVPSSGPRKTILVGHDVLQDVGYLVHLDYNIPVHNDSLPYSTTPRSGSPKEDNSPKADQAHNTSTSSNDPTTSSKQLSSSPKQHQDPLPVAIADTTRLHLAHTHAPTSQPKSLLKLLNEFSLGSLCSRNHHNGGNDAVHTMWVLLAIAVQHASERGEENERVRREKQDRRRVEELERRRGEMEREVDVWVGGWEGSDVETEGVGGVELDGSEGNGVGEAEREEKVKDLMGTW
ncbi:MAG: hypothetical protein M1831_000245 [Alyxoria varia]|nr:MAG: hypothetical protein M1831_000245 [Alyxoria varia]